MYSVMKLIVVDMNTVMPIVFGMRLKKFDSIVQYSADGMAYCNAITFSSIPLNPSAYPIDIATIGATMSFSELASITNLIGM